MWLFFEKYEVNELHIPICEKTESELGIYFYHPNFILSEKRLKSHFRIFIFQIYQAWVNSAEAFQVFMYGKITASIVANI